MAPVTPEYQQQMARLQVLRAVSAVFANSTQDLAAVLEQVAALTAAALSDFCSIRLLTDDGEGLEAGAIFGPNPEFANALREVLAAAPQRVSDSCFYTDAVRTGQIQWAPKLEEEEARSLVPHLMWHYLEHAHSLLVAPLVILQRTIGFLTLIRFRPDLPAFELDDVTVAQDLADRIALAIHNAQLSGQLRQGMAEHEYREQALARMAERLNLATKAAKIGIWDWDIEHNELVWDDQMYDLYGLKPDEFQGAYEAWIKGIYPEDRVVSNAVSQLAVRGEREYDTEFRVLWPDGTVHWLKASGQVFWNEDGRPVRMIGVNYDITASKHAAAALLESELRYSALFENAAMPLALTKLPEAVFVDINQAFVKMFGYTQQEVFGKTSLELGMVLPQEHAQTAAAIRQFGHSIGDEKHLFTKFGEARVAVTNAKSLQFGDSQYVITTIADITERKRAEQALRLRTEELEQVLNLLPAAIWIAEDAACLFIRGNRYANDLLGVGADANISQSASAPAVLLRQFIDGRELKPDELPMQVAARTGEPQVGVELRIDRDDLMPRVLIGGATPLFTEDGGVRGAVAAFFDITERKVAEDELRRSNAELEQFAYVASHDLQEPLRAVAGMVRLLQQRYQGQLDARADEYIGQAVDAANRMQTLINDLLMYSRVGRQGTRLTPVASTTCLEAAIANLRIAIRENNATIQWDELPIVAADSTQLTQLFQNLLSNGIKFHIERPPEIHIRAVRTKDAWHFMVRDNGIGIDPQYFERIFLVFQRLHTRREYAGTGIGLAVCKKIVEHHGGAIWVESQPGEGTTFHFTLPERNRPNGR